MNPCGATPQLVSNQSPNLNDNLPPRPWHTVSKRIGGCVSLWVVTFKTLPSRWFMAGLVPFYPTPALQKRPPKVATCPLIVQRNSLFAIASSQAHVDTTESYSSKLGPYIYRPKFAVFRKDTLSNKRVDQFPVRIIFLHFHLALCIP